MIVINRWLYGSDGSVIFKNVNLTPDEPSYDDVVDRSHFVPDSESVRNSVLSGSGLSRQGVFDDVEPTDIEVAIRSGKLDKAEVYQLQKAKLDEAKQSVDDAMKKQSIDEANAISDARQAYLDSKTGFDPTNVSV